MMKIFKMIGDYIQRKRENAERMDAEYRAAYTRCSETGNWDAWDYVHKITRR